MPQFDFYIMAIGQVQHGAEDGVLDCIWIAHGPSISSSRTHMPASMGLSTSPPLSAQSLNAPRL